MESITVTLPESIQAFVDEQVSRGGYRGADDFLIVLIREHQKQQEEQRLESLLVAGLDSGEPVPATPDFWEAKMQRLREQSVRP